MAEPGEFTYRAFMNGRIDLAQAEGVMRMIRAGSERAMRSAVRQMEGGVSAFVRTARAEITSPAGGDGCGDRLPGRGGRDADRAGSDGFLQSDCGQIGGRL